MGLDLGELVGRIGMDISPLERALTQGDAALGKFATKGESDAKSAGTKIGGAVAEGLDTIQPAALAASSQLNQALSMAEAGAHRTGDQIAAGVNQGLAAIPEAARVAAGDFITQLEVLPRNVDGTVSRASEAWKKLPLDAQLAGIQMNQEIELAGQRAGTSVGTALDGAGPKLRSSGADAGREGAKGLDDGLDDARGVGEDAGEEAGEGMLSTISGKAKLAGAAAALALGVALAGALSMDAANDKLAAQLGLSAAESERIGGVAGRLYAGAYGDSLESVNVAVAAVMTSIEGMSSASSGRIEQVTAKVLDFASAFEIDTARAVQIVGQLISTGLAPNANQAFDLIVAGAQRVPAALREDLLDAVDEYGQFFSGLGYSGEQAFALLVEASEKGMYGIDKAGDAVKEFTIRSTDMSAASKAAYESIGLDAGKMANDILAGGDRAQGATQKIIDGILGIKDPAKQAQAAIALFGTPIEDLAVKDIPAFLQSLRGSSDAMDGFDGSAKRMGDTLNDNASTNLESFKRQVKVAIVDFLGGTAIPYISDFASALSTKVGPALSTIGGALSGTLLPKLQEWVTIIGAVAVPVLNTLATVLAAVTGFLAEHSTVAQVLAGVMIALTVVTAAHAAALAVSAAGGMAAWLLQTNLISGAVKVWTAVQWLLNAALSANPIGIIVVAIAALVAGLIIAYQKSETFRDIVNAAFGAVKDVAMAVFDWLTNAVATVIGFIQDHWKLLVGIIGGPIAAIVLLITSNWDTIKSVTSTVWNAIVDFIKAIPGKILAFFLNWTLPGLIIKHWDTIKDGTGKAWDWILDFVKAIPGKIVDFFMKWTLPGIIISHWDEIKSGTIRVATSMVDWVKDLPGRIIDALSSLGGKLRETGADAWGKFREVAGDKISAMLEWVKGIPGRIISAFGNVTSVLSDVGRKIMGSLWDGLKEIWENIKDWAGSLDLGSLLPDLPDIHIPGLGALPGAATSLAFDPSATYASSTAYVQAPYMAAPGAQSAGSGDGWAQVVEELQTLRQAVQDQPRVSRQLDRQGG